MKRLFALLGALASLTTIHAWAQDAQGPQTEVSEVTVEAERRENEVAETAVMAVTVTGSAIGVRQGGAQDISYFRNEAGFDRIPQPDTITFEGLLGDHDIRVPGQRACAQLFCLTGEALHAQIPSRAEDRAAVVIAFDTNIQGETWRRQPLNLVAVVDKSGSMDGSPLDLVRRSLRQIVSQLGPDDQISIVLYGDTAHLYMPAMRVTDANRADILRQIDGIASMGSTYMEAGLTVGFQQAFSTAPAFQGVTRVMLFTDEQPNVGDTSAEGFMGMAIDASTHGVGLTTIGVGVQYDADLGTRIASVRGGNLFFIADETQVRDVFQNNLDTMVSELAQDLKVTMRPSPGYRITGVFGVPGDMLRSEADGAVSFTLPTVFLSRHGGALLVALAPSETALPAPEVPGALLTVDLTYNAAAGRGSDRLVVGAPVSSPGDGARLTLALFDEFLTLREATRLFHAESDEEGAFQALRALQVRLGRTRDPRLDPERRLVRQLVTRTAFLSGHTSEPPRDARYLGLIGDWEVEDARGRMDFRRGDRVRFLEESGEVQPPERSARGDWSFDYQANNRRILIDGQRPLLSYRQDGDELVLENNNLGVTVVLRRLPAAPGEG